MSHYTFYNLLGSFVSVWNNDTKPAEYLGLLRNRFGGEERKDWSADFNKPMASAQLDELINHFLERRNRLWNEELELLHNGWNQYDPDAGIDMMDSLKHQLILFDLKLELKDVASGSSWYKISKID